jgi:hypothetical protein
LTATSIKKVSRSYLIAYGNPSLQLRLFQSRMCQVNNRRGQTLQVVACPQLCLPQHRRRTTTGSSRKARRGPYPAAEHCGCHTQSVRRLQAVTTLRQRQCSEQLGLLRYAAFWMKPCRLPQINACRLSLLKGLAGIVQMLNPANAHKQRCPRCQSPLNTVVVHRHEQCVVCKSNIFECCLGDTCQTELPPENRTLTSTTASCGVSVVQYCSAFYSIKNYNIITNLAPPKLERSTSMLPS